MRITRDTLLKIARETVERYTRQDRTVMAAYLSGSLLGDDFQIGGAADIDLFFIHTDHVPQEREIIPITEEVHLDIAHHLYKDYRQTRNLRVHPWLGPVLNNAAVMYDPQHFLDFTQASVRGQFDRGDHIVSRVRPQLEMSRQIWFNLQTLEAEPGFGAITSYLNSLALAANAIASINSSPLTERRFLLNFSQLATAIGRPGLYPGLIGLLGAPYIHFDTMPEWLSSWQAAYEEIPEEKRPARLNLARLPYYLNAFEAFLKTDQPEVMLYPFLRTWTQAISYVTKDDHFTRYQAALSQLGLVGDAFPERVKALDAYLDVVEETVENWSKENGVWIQP